MALDDGIKIEQLLSSYLLSNIAQWVLSNPTFTTWETTKKALIETYGILVAQQKQICRAKLDALKQDRIPSRQFKAAFQSIVQELPEGTSFHKETLRSIYLTVMNSRLMEKVIGRISTTSTWEDVANEAISMDVILNVDPRCKISSNIDLKLKFYFYKID